jgi:hypothetical protein
MRTREFGFVAISRFVAVERYCQSHQPSSTHPRQSSGVDRTGGHANNQDRRSGSQAPARPEHG